MRCLLFIVYLCCAVQPLSLTSAEFVGWKSMEVVKIDDGRQRGFSDAASVLSSGDVNGDGCQNLMVIKRRQSLIEWYEYLPSDKRSVNMNSEDINALPLSPRFQRHEFRLERLPRDVVVLGSKRLAVLVGPPNQIEIYQYVDLKKELKQKTPQQWQLEQTIPLLSGEPVGHLRMLHLAERNELLIATDRGTQVVSLDKTATVSWVRPLEDVVPWRWFLNDMDGDGDQDLVKTYNSALESIVWHRYENGFRPPQSIYEEKMRDAIVLNNKNAASDILIIDAIGSSLLRRYQLRAEAEQRFGHRRALSLPGQQAAWAGLRLGDDLALVTIDTEHPQFLVYVYAEGDWKQALNFPCIDNVEAVFAPQAEPGVLLLKRKDDAELYRSEWSQGRLSFPQPWQPAEHQAKEVKLLQMGRVGGLVWWTQKQDDKIVLFKWEAQNEQPSIIEYPEQGKKIESAIWLGNNLLLAKDSFKREGRVLNVVNGQVQVSQGAHLNSVKIEEYRAQLNQAGDIVPMRLQSGVLQWLDGNLHALDQVMLEDGLSINDFVVMGQEQFVLEAGSKHLVQLEKDASGVMRRINQFDIPGGYALKVDPVLGLCIQEPGWVCRLDRGQAWNLQALEHIDERQGKPEDLQEVNFDRLFPVLVKGSENEAFLVSDDGRHRLSLFERGETATNALASWQVFEDSAYPYGAPQAQNRQREPRVVESMFIDDDKDPDLVLMCHDRLLLYLSQEN